MNVRIARATADDWPSIVRLLQDSGLPTDGLQAHLETAFIARDGQQVIGCAALETYSDGVLLRSVVVTPHARGRGVGRQLVEAALALADSLGATATYLLTTTAGEYFPALGFTPATRARVPAGVRQSVEFRSACPESAVVMHRRGPRTTAWTEGSPVSDPDMPTT